MNEFLENFKKNVHLRTAHSELVGYWSVEFGGRMNKVFHIWKYDNFAHRTAVRKALAKDKEWQEQFLIPNLALIDKQESEITYLVPWCKIERPAKEGIYELATFQMKPGGPALWGNAFKRAVHTHVNRGYTKLVGVFHTEYGVLNRVHVLWWHESADTRASGRHESHEDPRVVAADNFAHRTAVRKAVAKDKEWQEQFLIPNLALIDKQESEITYLVPWCQIERPAKEGVYELATFQMKPGGPALWGDAFKRAIKAHVDLGYTKLVGVFHTEYGALNRVRESVNYLESQQNMLLIPTSFSPLK
ncbi:Protein NipSnap like protein 3A [Fukomys damarensis]|uniref:Protein NipSnap like protein 3A n=1 Tax=Fukomys damarensis TaxID=885580 RepID=A0A091CPC9_FUKDA|nr:Protein NipSnap like protein 3A [Fukomys damarensis]